MIWTVSYSAKASVGNIFSYLYCIETDDTVGNILDISCYSLLLKSKNKNNQGTWDEQIYKVCVNKNNPFCESQ